MYNMYKYHLEPQSLTAMDQKIFKFHYLYLLSIKIENRIHAVIEFRDYRRRKISSNFNIRYLFIFLKHKDIH